MVAETRHRSTLKKNDANKRPQGKWRQVKELAFQCHFMYVSTCYVASSSMNILNKTERHFESQLTCSSASTAASLSTLTL